MSLHFKIITPDRTALEAEVDNIVVPGALGEMEVLTQHSNLITIIIPGELRYRMAGSGEEHQLVVGSGVFQIEHDRVILTTDLALETSDIDEKSVEEAIAAAQEALRQQEKLTVEERRRLDTNLAKQLAILEFNRKYQR